MSTAVHWSTVLSHPRAPAAQTALAQLRSSQGDPDSADRTDLLDEELSDILNAIAQDLGTTPRFVFEAVDEVRAEVARIVAEREDG